MVATPQLGDRVYRSADLIPPVAHYPKHTMSNPFEDSLRNTYFHAQHHSRVLFFQPYGYDLRDGINDSNTVARAFASTTWVTIARARRNLPEEITLIRCVMAVAVLSLARVTFNARITIANGSATDTASNSRAIDAYVANGPSNINDLSFNERARLRALFPFTSGHAAFVHEVFCGLSNIDPTNPGRCRITLDCYATHDQTGAAESVQPLFVMGLGEMLY